MRTLILPALLLIAAVFCFQRAFQSIAYADDGSGSSASTSPAAAPLPTSSSLPDPVASPGAAFDDVKAAKKVGWLVAVLAGLTMLGKGLGAAKSVSWLAWLGKGKTAVIVALLATTAAGCYDAAVSGGSWTAVAFAALLGLAHYKDATPATS